MDYLNSVWNRAKRVLFGQRANLVKEQKRDNIQQDTVTFRLNKSHQQLFLDLDRQIEEQRRNKQEQMMNILENEANSLSNQNQHVMIEQSPELVSESESNFELLGCQPHQLPIIQPQPDSLLEIYQQILSSNFQLSFLIPQLNTIYLQTQSSYQTALSLLNKDIQYFQKHQSNQSADDIFNSFRLKLYSYQKSYPLLKLQQLQQILHIFRNLSDIPAQVMRHIPIGQITYKSFSTLNKSKWLNDQVTNTYIQMIKYNLPKQSTYNIMNTFFTTKLNKSNMQRFITKYKINNSQKLIIPVHWNNNHWMFVTIIDGIIKLYDSLKNSSIPDILYDLSIRVFGKVEFVVEEGYPKQKGFEDCGVFMLEGIKAVCFELASWGFCSRTIYYKRIIIARDIVRGGIGLVKPERKLKNGEGGGEMMTEDQSD